ANPGTSEMHFVAALDRKPQMRCILGLFEGVVTGAADGYARMADKPAATLLHLGPGLANGLANLHNARRANTPMVNVVGEHASYHIQHDAPLTSDIESLARPMSDWVHRIQSADDVSSAAAAAIEVAKTEPGGIATLILPADAAWQDASPSIQRARSVEPSAIDEAALSRVREALRNGRKTVILLSGKALRAGALDIAGRIAAKTGAKLMAQQSNSQAIGALCPENAIICDEAVSSGRDSFKWTWNAAPHDFLQITGGAIGIGIPLAAGAAVACPDRKVILM